MKTRVHTLPFHTNRPPATFVAATTLHALTTHGPATVTSDEFTPDFQGLRVLACPGSLSFSTPGPAHGPHPAGRGDMGSGDIAGARWPCEDFMFQWWRSFGLRIPG